MLHSLVAAQAWCCDAPGRESVSTGWPVTERNLDGLRGKTRRVFRKVLEGWGLHQEVGNTGNGRRLQMDKE